MKNNIPYFLLLFFLVLNLSVNSQQLTFSKVIQETHVNVGIQTFDNCYMLACEDGNTIKIDSVGNVVWIKRFSTDNALSALLLYGLITSIDSSYVITGAATNTITGNTDALCMKLNAEGDTLWTKTISYNSSSLESLSVQQTNDSGFVMTGQFASEVVPNYGVFVTKIGSTGNLEWNYFY